MGGMDMMLKSVLGVDPAELKERVEKAATDFQKTVEFFNAKMDTVIENQKMLYALLRDAKLIESVEAFRAKQSNEEKSDGPSIN